MKKGTVVILTVLFACLFPALIGSNLKSNPEAQALCDPKEYVPNEVIVRFKEDIVGDTIQNKQTIKSVLNSAHARIKTFRNQEIDMLDWDPAIFAHRSFIGDPWLFLIRIPEYMRIDDAISLLKSDPRVEYAEKNGINHAMQTYPNDVYFQDLSQWGLYNYGSRKDIHAPEAWDISTGSSQVVVAVLDSGMDLVHADLAANLWTNPNEDGSDSDNNELVNDIHGWDFVTGDSDPTDDMSGDYHGTHVSGIIGAVGNNQMGISGVCWNVKIMVVKVMDADGDVTDAALVNGIDYATQSGAFVINISIGKHTAQPSSSIEAAIRRGLQKSRLFVCAEGEDDTHRNQGWNVDDGQASSHWYPADYTLDNIITVLATDMSDNKCDFSCSGEVSVDLGAPGFHILSTKPGDLYQYLNGTSMAAPHVSGVAALALGICPGLTSSRLKSMIVVDGVDKVSALEDTCVSEGRLNAYKVLNAIGGTAAPNAPSNLTACPTAWNVILLGWHDNSNNEVGFEIQKKDQYQTISFIHDNCADSNSTSTVSFEDETIDPSRQRTYTYRVRAANKAGISSFTNTAAASVPYTAPDAPTDLECLSAVYPNVHLSWSDMANNELHYFIERRISETGPWSVLTTLPPNRNSYTDSNVQRGRTYDYRVRANNPLEYSGYSNVITVEVVDW